MYDIFAQLINAPSSYANSYIIQACIIFIILFAIWFLDSIVRLFRFRV